MPEKVKRLHYSAKPIKRIKSTKKQSKTYKPNGFWYSCGTSWEEWSDRENFKIPKSYIYEVEIDESIIRKISNVKELDQFTEEFGVPNPLLQNIYKDSKTSFFEEDDHWIVIDWPTVSKKYSGIEICPYIRSRRMTYQWYYPWDVASGCIWNAKAINGLKLVKPEDNLMEGVSFVKLEDLDEKTSNEIYEYADSIGLSIEELDIEYDIIPAENKEQIKHWLKNKIDLEGKPDIDKVEKFCSKNELTRPIIVDFDSEYTVEGRHRLSAAYACEMDVPIVILRRKREIEEEFIGKRNGLSYYQMGGSLPTNLYNRTSSGKPTRDPGVGGIYKKKKK